MALRRISYQVTDATGLTSTAVAVVTVTPVNDPLVAGADAATTPKDQTVVINVLGNDVDIDGGALTVTSATIDPLQGVVGINRMARSASRRQPTSTVSRQSPTRCVGGRRCCNPGRHRHSDPRRRSAAPFE